MQRGVDSVVLFKNSIMGVCVEYGMPSNVTSRCSLAKSQNLATLFNAFAASIFSNTTSLSSHFIQTLWGGITIQVDCLWMILVLSLINLITEHYLFAI